MKNETKRAGVYLLAAVLVVALGCGGDGNTSTPTTPTTPTTTTDLSPSFPSGHSLTVQPGETYTVGVVVNVTLTAASGGDPPLTYTVSPSLPSGLTFGASARTITGTPTTAQTHREYSYRVTDADGDTASISFGITVAMAPEPVVGTPTLRLCADERERAENHSGFVFEWDGTPFRVDMIRNFPDFVTEADIASLLAPVGLLADKIERQLGYQILEMGEVIPIPRGTPPGWDEDTLAFRRNCPLPRDRGHILGFYMDDVLESAPSAGAQAHPRCGAFTYLRPGVGRRWPCSGCSKDGATVHEIFHVLGFVHADDYDFLERGDGVAMSEQLTDSDRWRGADAVTWADIDLLRCIFPQGG